MYLWIWSGSVPDVGTYSPRSLRCSASMKAGGSWIVSFPGSDQTAQARSTGPTWPFPAESRRTFYARPPCPRYCATFACGSKRTMCCAGGRRRHPKSSSGSTPHFCRHRPPYPTRSCWITWAPSWLRGTSRRKIPTKSPRPWV